MTTEAYTETTTDYCGTFYAARLLGVSVGTVHALVTRGELEGWKTKGGHRRISMDSLQQYLEQNGSKSPLSVTEPFTRVLVVDDEESTREMMVTLISKLKVPVDCTAMSSAMEALLDLQNLKPDVLFTDLNMPGVDGLALLRTLKASPVFDGMVMVAITGLSEASIAERGGLPPDTIVVEKPISPVWLQGFLTALATVRAMSLRAGA